MHETLGNRRMRRRTTRLLTASAGLALVATGSGAAFAAEPKQTGAAASDPRNGICEATEFCLIQHKNGGGYVFDYAQGSSDSTYDGNVFPGTNIKLNDEASSWINNSRYRICIYDDSNYGGDVQLLPRNGGYGNMDDTAVGGDDASSHRLEPVAGAGCPED
jgi:Peptidase inhibitor family I36